MSTENMALPKAVERETVLKDRYCLDPWLTFTYRYTLPYHFAQSSLVDIAFIFGVNLYAS